MAGVLSRFGPSAKRLIDRDGSARMLERLPNDPTNVDPATGEPSGNPILINGKGAITSIRSNEVDGNSIRIGDKVMVYYGDAIEKNDRLDNYRVVDVNTINTDESGIVYQRCILRAS